MIRSDLAGIRTQDPIIKSDMLYLLSYEIKPFFKSSANIGICSTFQIDRPPFFSERHKVAPIPRRQWVQH